MRGKRKWRSHVASVPQQILFEVVDSLAQVRRFYLGVYMPELIDSPGTTAPHVQLNFLLSFCTI